MTNLRLSVLGAMQMRNGKNNRTLTITLSLTLILTLTLTLTLFLTLKLTVTALRYLHCTEYR